MNYLLTYCFPFFQYRFATGMELFLLFIGFLGAVVTAVTTPLNTLFFGDLTGEMIKYSTQQHELSEISKNPNRTNVTDPTYTSQDLLDAVEKFAIQNTVLGAAMLVASYISIWSFNFVGSRQVN